MITLVVFTCEGREDLLGKTIDSFKSVCDYTFDNVILGIDGKVNTEIIDKINPTVVVQNHKRRGYVSNIHNALQQISAEYFFWLEDDWHFLKEVDIPKMVEILNEDKQAIQVVLSKSDKGSEALDTIYPGVSIGQVGFSANPCLCRTSFLKDAFDKMSNSSKQEASKLIGFENFISVYMTENHLRNLMVHHHDKEVVQHSGFIDSTAREYHMIHSLHEGVSNTSDYISGFGHYKNITLLNKLAMLPKLWVSIFVLTYSLFSRREAYDFALRIYLSYLRKFRT